MGRPAQAEQLITGVESRFASVRREHPEFVGAPLIVTERLEVSTVYIRTEKEPQNGLFRELGFTQPEPIAELLVDEDGYSGNLSDERMELLDTASVVVWNLVTIDDLHGALSRRRFLARRSPQGCSPPADRTPPQARPYRRSPPPSGPRCRPRLKEDP